MKHFALIGFPLGHSLSASYFAEKFSREGIDAEYSPLAIEQAEEVLPYCSRLSGFNVTIPHKQAIMPLLAEISEEAQAIGAVNCVKVCEDGRLVGYNTDVIGIRKSLEGVELQGRKALVLGTGGASKAVQYVLRKGGADIKVVSRSKGAANLTYEELSEELIRECRLIVNTTPLGMFPKVESAPQLPYSALSSEHTLFDCVYNPRQTKFLQLGAAQGARTIDGLTMFYAQAEASWEIWND
ncbi:MAG: shikimate dehydrogenase [Rikenellaceae bacterium]|nr:shikimate dehydrogenase [Rikenellaceae bacterium]